MRREKRRGTSLTLGTGRKRLWLLRSRPDQVDRATMRGGPSDRHCNRLERPHLNILAIRSARTRVDPSGICLGASEIRLALLQSAA